MEEPAPGAEVRRAIERLPDLVNGDEGASRSAAVR